MKESGDGDGDRDDGINIDSNNGLSWTFTQYISKVTPFFLMES